MVYFFFNAEKLEKMKKYTTSFVIDIYFASFPFLFAKKGQWLISINNNHKLEKNRNSRVFKDIVTLVVLAIIIL